MTDQSIGLVLRRKAAVARESAEERELSPSKALRLAFARAADEALDLAIHAKEVAVNLRALMPISESLSDEHCLILLEGPLGARGLIIFDQALLVSLIEAQTIGTVTKGEIVPRNVTATDAALCQPLVDGVLSRFEALLAHTTHSGWSKGFRFGSHLAETRLVPLALEDLPYRVFELTLDISLGAKTGAASIILPVEPRETAPTGPSPEKLKHREDLGNMVQKLPAELHVVLAKQRMSLAALKGLSAGDVLSLADASFDNAVLQSDGRSLARVKIGQMDDNRAVCLCKNEEQNAPLVMLEDLSGSGSMTTPSMEFEDQDGDVIDEIPETETIEDVGIDIAQLPQEDVAMELPELPDLADD